MGERGRDPKEKRCGICGKDIYAGEEWAYKRKYHGEKTIWFCSYKCMRAYDATVGEPKKPTAEPETEPKTPKEPMSRADQAKALAREILAGRSVIAWLKKEGYKNPHEAYSAVRHYAQTKMPELAETLKPLKDLPKAPPAARTGRPRKYPAKVETVDKVPDVEPDLEPVQCIAHVTDAEIEEAMKNMRQRHDNLIVPGAQEAEEQKEPEKPKVDTSIAMKELSKAVHKFANSIFTRDRVLRIVDKAALDCMETKRARWGGSTEQQEMLHDTKLNAEGVGVMKLRDKIREMLEADDDE